MMNQKCKTFLSTALLTSLQYSAVFSQSRFGQALNRATADLKADYPAMRGFSLAICAGAAIYGMIKVFNKFQSNDQDTSKSVANWVYALMYFGIAGFLIQLIFINP